MRSANVSIDGSTHFAFIIHGAGAISPKNLLLRVLYLIFRYNEEITLLLEVVQSVRSILVAGAGFEPTTFGL